MSFQRLSSSRNDDDYAVRQNPNTKKAQRKKSMIVSAANAPAEQEAEAMADEIQEEGSLIGTMGQASAGAAGGTEIPEDTSDAIQHAKTGGSELSPSVKENLEEKFGNNLDHVRLHQGEAAHALNDALAAKAFTSGDHVFTTGTADAEDPILQREVANTFLNEDDEDEEVILRTPDPTKQLADLHKYETLVEPWKLKKAKAEKDVNDQRATAEENSKDDDHATIRKALGQRRKAAKKIAGLEKKINKQQDKYIKKSRKKKKHLDKKWNRFEGKANKKFGRLNTWVNAYNAANDTIVATREKNQKPTEALRDEFNIPLKDVAQKITTTDKTTFLKDVKAEKKSAVTTKADLNSFNSPEGKLIRVKEFFPAADSYDSYEAFKATTEDIDAFRQSPFAPPTFHGERKGRQISDEAAYLVHVLRFKEFEDMEALRAVDPATIAHDLIREYVKAQFNYLNYDRGGDLNHEFVRLLTDDLQSVIKLPLLTNDDKRVILRYASTKTDMKASERYYLQLFMQFFLKDKEDYEAVFGSDVPGIENKKVTPERMLELTENSKIVDDYYKLSKKKDDKEYYDDILEAHNQDKRKNFKTMKLVNRKIDAKDGSKKEKRLEKRIAHRAKKGFPGYYSGNALMERDQIVETLDYTENVIRKNLFHLAGEGQIKKGKYPVNKEQFPNLSKTPITEEMVMDYANVVGIQTNHEYQAAHSLLSVQGITPDVGDATQLNEAKLDYFNLMYGGNLAQAQQDFAGTPFGNILATVSSTSDITAAQLNGVDLFRGIPSEYKTNGWPVDPNKYIFGKLKDVFKKGYEKQLKDYGLFLLRDKTDYTRRLQWPQHWGLKTFDKMNKYWYLTYTGAAVVVAYPVYNIFKDFDFDNSEGMLINDLVSLSNIAGGFMAKDGIKLFEAKLGNDHTFGKEHYDQAKLKGMLQFGNRETILGKYDALNSFNAPLANERKQYSAPFALSSNYKFTDGFQHNTHGAFTQEANVSGAFSGYAANPNGAYHGITAGNQFLNGDLTGAAKPTLSDYTNLLFKGTHDANPAQFPATTKSLLDYKVAGDYKFAYRDFGFGTSGEYLSLNQYNNGQFANQANRSTAQANLNYKLPFDKTHALSFATNNTFTQTNIAGTSQTNAFSTSFNSNYVGQPFDKSSEFRVDLGGTYSHTQIKNLLTGATSQKDIWGLSASMGFKLDPSFIKNHVDQLEFRVSLSSTDLSQPLNTAQFKIFLMVRPNLFPAKSSPPATGF